MDPIADTMPEARHRRTKKKAQPSEQSAARLTAVLEPGAPATKAEAAKLTASKSKTKKKAGDELVAWWPVGLGIFLCGFAPEWRQAAAEIGVWAERLLFPLALLVQHHEIGAVGRMAEIAPKAALYLQLPLEGLLTKLTLDLGKGLRSAMLLLITLHLAGAGALWLLTYMH
jgi:hypothetical protein